MSYENPVTANPSYNAQDFGAGTITKRLRPPRGATRGRVEGIHAFATEVFNQVTTQGAIQIGVTGNLDKFAELLMGALAAAATLSDSDQVKSLKLDGQFDLDQEVDDELTFTFVAPTGGTPTGIADVEILISWFY